MAERGTISNGDEVKDEITSMKGVVIAETYWLNGCVRLIVQPRELKDGKPVEAQTFDIEQLILIKKAKPVAKSPTGGPHDAPVRQAAAVRR